MRKAWMFIALVALAVWATPAAAQDYRDIVVQQMDAVTAELRGQGYQADPASHDQEFVVGLLEEGGLVGLEVKLQSGRHYAIVGFCDQDCGDLDLALATTDGELLFQDEAEDDYPVLEFVAPRGERFVVITRMYGCATDACGFAYQVFRK